MQMRFLIPILLCCSMACNIDSDEKTDVAIASAQTETAFDKAKWRIKEGHNYPYRDQMLDAIVSNDTIRTLDKEQIIELLGEPSYYGSDESYLYYRINEKRLLFWTLHTKTLVIKRAEDGSIEWIKIHD